MSFDALAVNKVEVWIGFIGALNSASAAVVVIGDVLCWREAFVIAELHAGRTLAAAVYAQLALGADNSASAAVIDVIFECKAACGAAGSGAWKVCRGAAAEPSLCRLEDAFFCLAACVSASTAIFIGIGDAFAFAAKGVQRAQIGIFGVIAFLISNVIGKGIGASSEEDA